MSSLTSSTGQLVGTAEREAAVALLGDAVTAGYLNAYEFTARAEAAYTARTRQELDAAVAGLPAEWVAERARRAHRERQAAAARSVLRAHLAAYLAAAVLMIGIWLAVGVAGGGWYPWPVWPILGWGVCLAGRLRPRYLS